MSYHKTRYTGVYYRLSQDNDKIYYIRYNINKKQHEERVGPASQGVTEKFSANLRIQRLSQNSLLSKKHLLNDMIDIYLDTVKNNPRLHKQDSARFDKHIRPFFQNKYLNEITTADVIAFKKLLFDMKRYALQTIKHYLILISKIFNFAKRAGYYDGDNPATIDKVKMPKFDNSRNTFLNDDEVERYIALCKSGNLKEHEAGLFLFAIFTGFRLSEITSLKWREVDIEKRFVRLVDTKSNKNHIIILSQSAIEVLKMVAVSQRSEYAFTHEDGRPFNDIRKLWLRFKKMALIRDEVRFHDIRHTFGTQAVTAGVPIDVLQRMMTHADIKTTQRYAHIVDKRLHEAAATIDKIYQKKTDKQ